MTKYLYTFLLILLFSITSLGQTNEELHEMSLGTINSDPNMAMDYANQQIENSDENSIDRVNGLNDLGNAHYYLDNYDDGIEVLTKAIKISEKINYPQGKAEASVIIANICILQGKFSKGLTYFTDALSIYEKTGDTDGTADCYNGIGVINLNQENYEKALEYFNKALEIGEGITKGDSYSYMSLIYLHLEAYDEAAHYAQEAIDIGNINEDTYVQAMGWDVMGVVASTSGEFDKANEYLTLALQMKVDLEDLQGTAHTLNFIAENFKSVDQIDSAMFYSLQAKKIAEEIGATEELRTALGDLAKLYAIQGEYENAFVHQTEYIAVNEAIFNDQASKKVAEMEAEMQAAIDAKIHEEEIALLEKDKEVQAKMLKIYIGFGIFIFLVLIAGAFAIYKRYQAKKKAHADLEQKNSIIEDQKQILENQKHILEEKNTEIMDSITYAKRIQTAILPSDKFFSEMLPNAFVLYKPKDIIAGDFYWLEHVAEENRLLFAAADCTGHGVPGAMVSVVCNNALNRSVREFSLMNPSEILDKTRELVIEQFEKSESEVKDGMDISMISMKQKANEELQLEWSGANNPIWIIRKNEGVNQLQTINQQTGEEILREPNIEEGEYVLYEMKADKQPIGKYADPKPFTNWIIHVRKEDSLYIFTDGFQDQFGGDRGKKFMASKMKKMMLEFQNLPIHEQKELLDHRFEDYRGDHEQIDDVCVIGIKI